MLAPLRTSCLTSLWWVFWLGTVFRLMDMTMSGGGGRSFTTEIRSLFRAMASTLHQLMGWVHNSEHKTTDYWCIIIYFSPNHILIALIRDSRGVLTSSQQGPRIFLLRRKCSKLEVFVPKTWEKVEPFRSDGSWGISAYGTRDTNLRNKQNFK